MTLPVMGIATFHEHKNNMTLPVMGIAMCIQLTCLVYWCDGYCLQMLHIFGVYDLALRGITGEGVCLCLIKQCYVIFEGPNNWIQCWTKSSL